MTVNMKLKTMISTLQKISAGFALLVTLVCAVPFSAQAQEAISYTVSPTIYDMTANPGQAFRSTLRIINTNSFELHVYVEMNNFVPKGEDGVPQFLPATKDSADQTTLAQWVDVDKELIIGAEQTVELPFTINVPADASPGGHFAAIMVGTKPPVDDKKENRVQTSQTISSLMFLRVTGDINESSSIRSFRTSSYILSKPEATFEIRVENKGNVHLQPQGEIKIFNMWGQERGVIPINQQSMFGNVLPNSVRKFSFTWSSEWSFSDIGRYTAVATLAYGVDKRQFMTADTAFWIIPWKILLTIILVVGGFIALVSWAIKAYVRRMLALAGVTPGSRVQAIAEAVPPVKKRGRPKKSVEAVKETTKLITAPIGAGILDLRNKLSGKETLKARLVTSWEFVKQYWKFFAVLGAMIVFVILLTLFLKGAYGPGNDYKVKMHANGQEVTVSTGTQGNSATPADEATDKATDAKITIVNRSGDESLTQKISDVLNQHGYAIGTTTNDFGSLEEKTVVVYDPADAQGAMAVSKLLGNALLSAYTDTAEHKGVLVYIGKDAKTVE
jgi:LytR cell envelope-related transcriptional attenuator